MSFRKPREVWNPPYENVPLPEFVCARRDGGRGQIGAKLDPSLTLSQVISLLSRHVMLSNGVVKRCNALWVFLRNLGFVPLSLSAWPQGLLLSLSPDIKSFAHVCTAPMWRRMNWLRFNPKRTLWWIWGMRCISFVLKYFEILKNSFFCDWIEQFHFYWMFKAD